MSNSYMVGICPSQENVFLCDKKNKILAAPKVRLP